MTSDMNIASRFIISIVQNVVQKWRTSNMAQRVCPICKKEISRGWAITNDGKLFFHKSCQKKYIDECIRKIFSVAKEREMENKQ